MLGAVVFLSVVVEGSPDCPFGVLLITSSGRMGFGDNDIEASKMQGAAQEGVTTARRKLSYQNYN